MNDPNSMLTAGQLAVMAVVVVLALAVWLGSVFLAARQSRGTSAAAIARPRAEDRAANVTSLRPDDEHAGRQAA
jgi:hypothetical protein